jgi:hypothetical protein
MTFKPGDRVRVKPGWAFAGKTGEVLAIDPDRVSPVLVEMYVPFLQEWWFREEALEEGAHVQAR